MQTPPRQPSSRRASARILSAWAFLLLLILAGCGKETRTITGQVVDEAGTPLAGASVVACYSGWGWSHGSLVWDKDYCSEPTLTDRSGGYRISFTGPESMRMRVTKEGWVQARDFNSTAPRLILTPQADYSARQKADATAREASFRQRLTDETAADYYCRVILERVRPVEINYRQARLELVPALYVDAEAGEMLALRGPAAEVAAMAAEMVVKVDGRTLPVATRPVPQPAPCGSEFYLLDLSLPTPLPEDRVELLIPSISAQFDAQIWPAANP